MMPPSAIPISKRAASKVIKPVAQPENTDAAENARVVTTRMALRRPMASDKRPTNKPAKAQLNDKAPAIKPHWVCVSPKSGMMKDCRKLNALRSKNTMPKLKLSNKTSIHW